MLVWFFYCGFALRSLYSNWLVLSAYSCDRIFQCTPAAVTEMQGLGVFGVWHFSALERVRWFSALERVRFVSTRETPVEVMGFCGHLE